MRFKLISCEVFTRPAYQASAHSPHIIDMEFTRLKSHEKPDDLRREIQSIIDRTPETVDAILLGFGLCGNSTVGLHARNVPLVIPRAHDCCTIFLGSRGSFLTHFGQSFSARWNTACYFERSDGWYSDNALSMMGKQQDAVYRDLVEKYGEENAEYIWETMNTEHTVGFLTYIDLPGIPDNGIREAFVRHAEDEGKEQRFLTGSTRLIQKLIAGEWDDEEYLTVPPGKSIKAIYDHDRIMELEEDEFYDKI